MLLGLGIDVASVARIRASLERFGDRFWQRILTQDEQADLRGRADRCEADEDAAGPAAHRSIFRVARHTAKRRSGTRRMQTRGSNHEFQTRCRQCSESLSNVILRVHKAKRVMRDLVGGEEYPPLNYDRQSNYLFL